MIIRVSIIDEPDMAKNERVEKIPKDSHLKE